MLGETIVDDLHTMVTSFMLLPQVENRVWKNEEDLRESLPSAGLNYGLYGRKDCPNMIYSNITQIQQRSTCPWYVEMSYDENRIPKVIARARCSCKTCSLRSDVAPEFNNAFKSYKCRSVYFYMKVLRRRKYCEPDGYYKYEVITEKVPVGCTCVVPYTRWLNQ